MPEFFIILLVVAVFLGISFLASVACKREVLRNEREEKPPDRRAA